MKKSDLNEKAIKDLGTATGELGKRIVEVCKDQPGEVIALALVDVLAFATKNGDDALEERIMAQYLAARKEYREQEAKEAKG